MLEERSFAAMRGMDILLFLRDSLADEAERKRKFVEDCERYAGGTTPAELRQRISALAAAAAAFDFIIGLGLEELQRAEKDPGRDFPPWIKRIVNQAKTKLIEEKPDAEDQPAG